MNPGVKESRLCTFREPFRILNNISFFPGVISRICKNSKEGNSTTLSSFKLLTPSKINWVIVAERRIGDKMYEGIRGKLTKLTIFSL